MASSLLASLPFLRTSLSFRFSQLIQLLPPKQQRHQFYLLTNAWRSYVSGADGGGNGDDRQKGYRKAAGIMEEVQPNHRSRQRRGLTLNDANDREKDVFKAFHQEGEVEKHEEDDGAEWEGTSQNSGSIKDQDCGAFGEQLALAGLTENDLDSLIAKMDFTGIKGLPPLDEILQQDPESEQKAKRREMEIRKQQELALSRVKKVDDLGRAYATGRRKTSVARVWLFEGKGKMLINGKTHDLYFPSLDHRVQLLEPFCETQTLGKFDVFSSVKGGGISGQAGALRLGISRALQFYNPELRPPLRANGMLTRDPRSVERKKPGKAKARKSYQWVKR